MGGLDLVLSFMLLSKPSKPEYFQLSQSHSDDEWTTSGPIWPGSGHKKWATIVIDKRAHFHIFLDCNR